MTTPIREQFTGALRHDGPCGRRVRCFRAECRAEFGDVATLEILAVVALAFCHRLAMPTDDPRLRDVVR